MAVEREKFLSRWSRLKQDAQDKDRTPQAPVAPALERTAPPPELPPVEKLSFDSDYRGFFHPKVDETLRRAALKRLFSDPHFNVMDGLDVYIDDYSKPSPLPAEMLATLRQAQKILDWAKEVPEGEKKQEHAAVPSQDAPALEVRAEDRIAVTPREPAGSNRVVPVPPDAPLSPEKKS